MGQRIWKKILRPWKRFWNEFAVKLLKELNKGEAETIVLAKELNASLVLMDERIPREMLELLGFSITGTVGILIRAAKEGLINIKEYLDELRGKGRIKSLI